MSEGILMTGFVAALIACFVPLEALANLISLGTLMVFTFVDAGIILLRLGSVSEISYETLNSENEMEEAKATTSKNQKRVVNLLLLFTISILVASFALSNNSSSLSKLTLLFCTTVAIICGILITFTPDSWIRKHRSTTASSSSSSSSRSHAFFECPCFPVIPLVGVALNTLLMGSLPLSSWLLCALWLACGLALYLTYGIKHSMLGKGRSPLQNLETDRLLENKSDYKSAEQ